MTFDFCSISDVLAFSLFKPIIPFMLTVLQWNNSRFSHFWQDRTSHTYVSVFLTSDLMCFAILYHVTLIYRLSEELVPRDWVKDGYQKTMSQIVLQRENTGCIVLIKVLKLKCASIEYLF